MPRAKLEPKDITDFFADPKRRSSPYDVSYKRQTYRIRPEMHSKLKEIAEAKGVGLNDLVRWIFGEFIKGFDSGDIELPVEEYVVTVSRLSS